MKNEKLYIIGANGTMGRAFSERATVVKQEVIGLTRHTDHYDEKVSAAKFVLLCTKQDATVGWLEKYGRNLGGKVLLSLAALLSIETLTGYCQHERARIGRLMTTTGVSDGDEEIVWTSDGRFSESQIESTQNILAKFGRAKYLGIKKDEEIDKKTFRACVVGWVAGMLGASRDGLVRDLGFTQEEADEAIRNASQKVGDQKARGLDFSEIQQRVMSRKGLTEAGVVSGADSLKLTVQKQHLAAKKRAEDIRNQYSKKGTNHAG